MNPEVVNINRSFQSYDTFGVLCKLENDLKGLGHGILGNTVIF